MPDDIVRKDLDKPVSQWKAVRKAMPVRNMTLGFVIPKFIFYSFLNRSAFMGAVLSVSWCFAVFVVFYLLKRRINWFTIYALIMIFIRMVPVIAKKDPRFGFIGTALDQAVLAMIFLGSLAWRPILELVVTTTRIKDTMPAQIVNSPYYTKAWRIASAVWGGVYLLEAFVLFLLAKHGAHYRPFIDMLCSWPTMVALILFTMHFTRWYWGRHVSVTRPA